MTPGEKNGRMNDHVYIRQWNPMIKHMGVFSCGRSGYALFRVQFLSRVRMWAIISLLVEQELGVAQVIMVILSASCSVPYMAYKDKCRCLHINTKHKHQLMQESAHNKQPNIDLHTWRSAAHNQQKQIQI